MKYFDIVIGNPPYGVSVKGSLRKDLEKSLGKVPDFEIYYFFIERAFQVLNYDSGLLSYIIPNTYLFNTFAAAYRFNILKNWIINEIIDCSSFSIFNSAVVRNTINLWQKGSSDTIGYRNTRNVKSFNDILQKPKSFIKSGDLLSFNQNWGLAFYLDKIVVDTLKKIEENSIALKVYFPEISQGLIAYDKYQGQSDEIIKSRAYHHFSNDNGKLKLWLWGADIQRFSVKWNGKEFLDYCDGIANPRQKKYFSGERLLIREITNPSIFAALATEELYNDPSILIILEGSSFSLKFLLAILNSKLASFYHFNHSPKATKGSFPKILIQDLKSFPLPSLAYIAEDEKIIELIDQIIIEKKNERPENLERTEKIIDIYIYKRYNLDYNEAVLIDPSLTTEEFSNSLLS